MVLLILIVRWSENFVFTLGILLMLFLFARSYVDVVEIARAYPVLVGNRMKFPAGVCESWFRLKFAMLFFISNR